MRHALYAAVQIEMPRVWPNRLQGQRPLGTSADADLHMAEDGKQSEAVYWGCFLAQACLLRHRGRQSGGTGTAHAVLLTWPDRSGSTTAAGNGCAAWSRWKRCTAAQRLGASHAQRGNESDQHCSRNNLIYLVKEKLFAGLLGQWVQAERVLIYCAIVLELGTADEQAGRFCRPSLALD